MNRDSELMRAFWDSKARENATYYVSSCRPYDDQDWKEFWEWGDRLAEQFLKESGISFDGNERILEIGCGIGRMTRYFARRFKEVHAVDVAPEMISRARENLTEFDNVNLHVGSGYDFKFLSDRSIEFVFSYITLQHISSVDISLEYIREAGRVLDTGGHFYFQVNNMPTSIRSRLRLRSRLRSLMNQNRKSSEPADTTSSGPKDLDHPAWQGSRLSVAQIEKACRSGNMKVLSLRGEGTQYLWVKASKQE